MPVKLRVPDRYAPSLAEFLRLSPQQLAAFLKALHEEQPNLALAELAEAITTRLQIDRGSVDQIITLLTSLHMAREGLGLSVADLVAELRNAMETSDREDLRPSDWAAFEDAIAEALSGETALSISAKALDLMQEHANVYCFGRVLTDLRPIFKSDVSQAPDALVTIHTLKLVYHHEGEHREFFVALDTDDVKKLAAVLDRALRKEEALKALTAGTVRTLEVKS